MSDERPSGASAATLLQPGSPEDWGSARALVEEYAASLQLDLDFQNFHHEITSLPREYGPPDACFILALQPGTGRDVLAIETLSGGRGGLPLAASCAR